MLGRAAGKPGQEFKARLTKLARAYVGFALKHPALLGLMFDAKHWPHAPNALREASEKALGHVPATFADAQAAGEVVPGDPWRLAVVLFATLLGLVSMSTDGKVKGVPLDRLVREIVNRTILGFRPR